MHDAINRHSDQIIELKKFSLRYLHFFGLCALYRSLPKSINSLPLKILEPIRLRFTTSQKASLYSSTPR